MIAEKLQPLVGRPAIARALERRNVGKRAVAQRQILEAIADTLFTSAMGKRRERASGRGPSGWSVYPAVVPVCSKCTRSQIRDFFDS